MIACQVLGLSALLHLNGSASNSSISVTIPVVNEFKYLGTVVPPPLNWTVKHNYSIVQTNVLKDMGKWMCLCWAWWERRERESKRGTGRKEGGRTQMQTGAQKCN